MPEVIAQTVAYDLCCGCGVCAGMCPRQNLSMQRDARGQYRPFSREDCPSGCSVCRRVCPFSLAQTNETDLAREVFGAVPDLTWHGELGSYRQLWIGHVATGRFREQGASGGAATWLLHELLTSGLVDAVVCVRPTGIAGRLYEFCIVRDPEELATTSRSAYYPVELSAVLREVRERDGRYAITGLPCVCKAIRLAMGVDSRLSERIAFLLGLVCGHGVTAAFTDYLAVKAGLNPRTLWKWASRVKDPTVPAHNSAFRGADDTHEASIHWQPVVGPAWNARVFTPRACLFCDDVFAETADIALMDAWLDPYMQDWRGANIVIARNPRLGELIERAIQESRLDLCPLPVNRVIASQAGALSEKRKVHGYRLWLEQQAGRVVPTKRITPVKPSLLTRRLLEYQAQVIRESHALADSIGDDAVAVARVDRLIGTYTRLGQRYAIVDRLRAKLQSAR